MSSDIHNSALRQYGLITASYWGFTLTDGALRMLVVLYFNQLGYGPFAIASLFLFYEFFGVLTNLLGGLLAARLGLATTLLLGLVLQLVALAMLLVEPDALTVLWVMAAQGLSGVAKDLTKMSAKSGIKVLIPADENSRLFRWVAALTGSKNALKGVGFFLGGALLAGFGFRGAIVWLLGGLFVLLVAALFGLDRAAGQASFKPKFSDLLSKSRSVNVLSASRFFLFGARDIWFVVALPVFLQLEAGWGALKVSTLMALWVIMYGVVQSAAPAALRFTDDHQVADGRRAVSWGMGLAVTTLGVWVLIVSGAPVWLGVVGGLMLFGVVFALNSALHSYLIVAYARSDGVSLDVGFYYMANAAGRLVGTLLSGAVYQLAGFSACIAVTGLFVLIASLISLALPSSRGPAGA